MERKGAEVDATAVSKHCRDGIVHHLCRLDDADDVQRLQGTVQPNLRGNVGLATKVVVDNGSVLDAAAKVLVARDFPHGLAVLARVGGVKNGA